MKSFRIFALFVLTAFVCAGLWAGSALSQVKPAGFTLPQVLSAPFPSDLTSATTGNRIAWVFNIQGKRNIWVAEAPDFKARQLTSFTADDGQEITELSLSRDGGTVVFVRGGDKNQAGEIPNPTSDTSGAHQGVWLQRWNDAQANMIGEGSAPAISPTGYWVTFVRDGQIYIAPVSSSSTAKEAFVARGVNNSVVWAPDGQSFAFASFRGDHSFIGVYDLASKSIHWISPSVDRDSNPRYSPDGRQLAFVRQPGRGGGGGGRGTANPWAVMVADAATGSSREVWQSAKDANGSLPNIAGENLLRWGAENRLIVGSEQDGWMHLYTVPTGGGSPTLLTPGNCEVENSAMTSDFRSVIYSSNCGDIDRRHLWRVSVTGGAPTQLTSGEKIEWAPVATGDGDWIAYLGSDAHLPGMPYIMSASGKSVKGIAAEQLPSDFPAAQMVTPQQVIFKAADGVEVHGQLFVPAGVSSGTKRPAVIFTHGGPIRQMLLGWHYMYYYNNSYAMNQYLASRGYVVLSVNYRGGIGYGRAFREPEKLGARGGSEYQDVLAGAKYLQGRPDVDTARIGLWGGSYGGYLTAMGLARNSDIFAAGVDFHGVHDWSTLNAGRGGGGNQAAQEIARQASPVASISTWKSPVLLIQGDDDRNVAFSQMVDLVQRLRAANVPFEQIVFPDEVHDFLLHRDWLAAYSASADFFDRKLKNNR